MARTKTITATRGKAKTTKPLRILTDAERAALPVANHREAFKALDAIDQALTDLAGTADLLDEIIGQQNAPDQVHNRDSPSPD
jgi:hypothetical protein